MECPIEVVPDGVWAYCLCVFSFALFQVKLHEMHVAED